MHFDAATQILEGFIVLCLYYMYICSGLVHFRQPDLQHRQSNKEIHDWTGEINTFNSYTLIVQICCSERAGVNRLLLESYGLLSGYGSVAN